MPTSICGACGAVGASSSIWWRLSSPLHARAWTTRDRKTQVTAVAADRVQRTAAAARAARAGPAVPAQVVARAGVLAPVALALPVLRVLPARPVLLVPAVWEGLPELAVRPGPPDRVGRREPPEVPPDQPGRVRQEPLGPAAPRAPRARRVRRATLRLAPTPAKRETRTCAPTLPEDGSSSAKTSA
jgi:hypothetical protein